MRVDIIQGGSMKILVDVQDESATVTFENEPDRDYWLDSIWQVAQANTLDFPFRVQILKVEDYFE